MPDYTSSEEDSMRAMHTLMFDRKPPSKSYIKKNNKMRREKYVLHVKRKKKIW